MHKRTLLPLALLFTVMGTSLPADAMTAPAEQTLDFTVMRDGEEIGSHTMTLRRAGDTVNVAIDTDVAVYLAFLRVYHFTHHGIETWRGDRLVSLKSKTDDDGTDHVLDVRMADQKLVGEADGKAIAKPADILPASLWNAAIVSKPATTVLNTLDGSSMAIRVTDAGPQTVAGPNGPVTAHHFILKGDLERELWFDAEGSLVKVQFNGKDGTPVEYMRR